MADTFSKEFIEDIIAGIWSGVISEKELPVNLYRKIAKTLLDALYKGYGGTLKDFKPDTRDYELLDELRTSVFHFSAAKTATQMQEMTEALVDNNGTVRSFSEFKKIAAEIFDTYNVRYLETERNTALASGQMAVLWNRIETEKKLFPYLEISVVEDDNTSEICQPLDGITLPVDDPFWDEYYPPNHFNCRSTVKQLDEDAKQSTGDQVDHAKEHADEHMTDEFKMNVGKDGYVFKDDHPYFQIGKADPAWGIDNYGLPIPE
jgi:SPP1 gp7 family putative phage head morphogenesis protein